MTDYTKTTDFAAKDSLPSGDSGKIIKGTEFETEFDNIATAIATKSNIASPTFTGTTTIPTVDINGGAIDGTTVGAASASTGAFTTLTASSSLNIASSTTVDGVLDEDNMASDSASKLATQQSIKAYVDSQVGSFDTLAEVLAQGNTTGGTDISVSTGDDITFANSSKAIFGSGSNLQIYYDGTDSYIDEQGSGALYIRGSNQLFLQSSTGTSYLVANDGGALNIRHNGNIKLATTSTGVDVTGTVTADGLTVDGDAVINDTIPQLQLMESDTTDLNSVLKTTAGQFRIQTINDAANSTTNRFIIDHGTGDISFYDTSANQGLFWDASAESLGIGTTSPSATIHANSASNGDTYFRGETGSTKGLLFSTFTANATDHAGHDINAISSLGEISFSVGSTKRLTIDSSGNVGIGTSSPDRPLHISSNPGILLLEDTGGAADDKRAQLQVDSGVFEINSRNDDNSSRVDNIFVADLGTGNIGIGTATPDNKFHVVSGAAGEVAQFTGAIEARGLSIRSETNTDASAHVVFNSQSGGSKGMFTFETDGTERMRIDSSGNLLVSTTSTFPGSVSNIAGIHLGGGTTPGRGYFSNDGGRALNLNRMSSDGEIIQFRKDIVTVGTISVTSSATAYNTSSDQRLKENIVDAPSASDDIDAIQVRSFDWKTDGSHQMYGMVAQELVTVAPEAVSQPEDPEEMMGVDYSKLVPMMLKEIQQLRARVAQLEGAN